MITILLALATLAQAEPTAWIHCESPNKDLIFENGTVTLEGRLFFKNITEMKPLYESQSIFKGKKRFTIIFLPAREKFSTSSISSFKDYLEDPIMNQLALHLDFSDFKKVSEETENKDFSNIERECRIKRKTTEFTAKVESTRQNEVIRTRLRCVRTDEERSADCN